MADQVAVLFLIFEGYNSLDLVAPIEIFSHNDALHGCGATYRTAIASATDNTTATEKVVIKRDHSFDELLARDGELLASFDILIVVGATHEAVHGAGYGTREVIRAFAQLEGRRSGSVSERWLVSICSGAVILGSLGLFAGKTVTTHFLALDDLRKTCAGVPGVTEPTTVVRKRWVSAGHTPQGARLLTSGGISCGIDATLWMVSEISSLQGAKNVAAMMDYKWDFPAGATSTTTEGYSVGHDPELLYVM